MEIKDIPKKVINYRIIIDDNLDDFVDKIWHSMTFVIDDFKHIYEPYVLEYKEIFVEIIKEKFKDNNYQAEFLSSQFLSALEFNEFIYLFRNYNNSLKDIFFINRKELDFLLKDLEDIYKEEKDFLSDEEYKKLIFNEIQNIYN
jgi:hypothetical protein